MSLPHSNIQFLGLSGSGFIKYIKAQTNKPKDTRSVIAGLGLIIFWTAGSEGKALSSPQVLPTAQLKWIVARIRNTKDKNTDNTTTLPFIGLDDQLRDIVNHYIFFFALVLDTVIHHNGTERTINSNDIWICF